jgi:hypothetical protein
VSTVTFDVDIDAVNYVVLVLSGMDDDVDQRVPMRINLNGHVVWEGESPFRDGFWTDEGWLIGDLTWLQAGENTLTIENLADSVDSPVGEPPWLLFSASIVYYG